MGQIKHIALSGEQRQALEQGYRQGSSHAFRQRCHLILLKSEGRTSAQVAEILDCCEVVVNTWLRRYQAEGLVGLHTRPGRGRKAILDDVADVAAVKAAVATNRQRISLAKAELEAALGKRFSEKTLTRFLKNTVAAINDCESVPNVSHVRTFTS